MFESEFCEEIELVKNFMIYSWHLWFNQNSILLTWNVSKQGNKCNLLPQKAWNILMTHTCFNVNLKKEIWSNKYFFHFCSVGLDFSNFKQKTPYLRKERCFNNFISLVKNALLNKHFGVVTGWFCSKPDLYQMCFTTKLLLRPHICQLYEVFKIILHTL